MTEFSDYDRRYEEAKPSPSEVADVLLAGADILEVDGWGQGDYHLSDGCHCALGALAVAAGYHRFDRIPEGYTFEEGSRPYYGEFDNLPALRRYDEAHRALTRYVRGALGLGVADWNDEPDRQPDEVIDGMRQAAAEVLAL